MGVYKADEAKSYEYQGTDTFRIEKSGGRAQIVFLYSDEASIDGYACHRLENASHYNFTVDCARGPKDPLDKCPACAAGEPVCTRVFVRMLDLATGKVIIWDKPASFRKQLTGFIHYFNPLFKQKYEITREGSGLETKYQYQSIGDSGITEKQYKEYLAMADEAVQNYVRPAEKYEEIKARCVNSQNEAAQEQVNVNASSAQNAWGAPPQQGWGQPQQGWGQPAQGQTPQQTAPSQQVSYPQGSWQPGPTDAPNPQQQGWSQPPQGGWGQPPQGGWQNNPGSN